MSTSFSYLNTVHIARQRETNLGTPVPRDDRYNFNVYYTLSTNYSSDDSERGISSLRYDDVRMLQKEYSYSNIDERNQLLIDGVVNLPFHVEMGGTTRLTSGWPFTAVAGTDLNKDGQNTDRPIVNGQVVARSTDRNTGFKDVSLRLQRNFTLPRELAVVSLSAEFFNALNFGNVQIGASNMSYGPGTPSSTARR